MGLSEKRMSSPHLPSPPSGAWHPSSRLRGAAAAGLILSTLVPVILVAWDAWYFLKNMPMWDEFETVLGFILHVCGSDSTATAISRFFSAANEHVMLTSRLITVVLYKLTGEVNFVHLAIAGNLFAFLAILVLGHAARSKWLGMLATAVASLLIFQLQNYENLFSSYASIDHFQIVLLTTSCLYFLTRGGGWQAAAAGVLATLAVFTLAHGVAVLAAGACALWLQKRRTAFWLWLGFSALVTGLFLWRLGAAPMVAPPFHGLAGFRAMIVYWLTMLGGIMSLGGRAAAPWAGLVLCVLMVLLLVLRGNRLDIFLCAVAINAILACALIAYGRVNFIAVSPLSSRYMVQSAIAWTACIVLLASVLPTLRSQVVASVAALMLAATISASASMKFSEEARRFSHRRVAAARYFDENGTFAGIRHPIFPVAEQADRIVSAARDAGIFRLQPRMSRRVEPLPSLDPHPLKYYLDKIFVGPRNIHVRGWMLTRQQVSLGLEPYVLLSQGEKRYLYRGLPDFRPDLAQAFPDRTDTEFSGFYCVIRRSELPPGPYKIDLVLMRGRRSFRSPTDHVLQVPAPAPAGDVSARAGVIVSAGAQNSSGSD